MIHSRRRADSPTCCSSEPLPAARCEPLRCRCPLRAGRPCIAIASVHSRAVTLMILVGYREKECTTSGLMPVKREAPAKLHASCSDGKEDCHRMPLSVTLAEHCGCRITGHDGMNTSVYRVKLESNAGQSGKSSHSSCGRAVSAAGEWRAPGEGSRGRKARVATHTPPVACRPRRQ